MKIFQALLCLTISIIMFVSCSSGSGSIAQYDGEEYADSAVEYDYYDSDYVGDVVEEVSDEDYSDDYNYIISEPEGIKPLTVYSSFFVLPAFNKIYSYDDCSEYSVMFYEHGGMVGVTDDSGKETVYDLFDSDYEGTGDDLYKALHDDKYMRWWSDGSGMAIITGAPKSTDVKACVVYLYTDLEDAKSNQQNFPSWRTSASENYSSSTYDSYYTDSYNTDSGSGSGSGYTSSSSGVCPDCGGKGYRPQAYTYSASANSYMNIAGNTCSICGGVTEHYHYRCTTCKRF